MLRYKLQATEKASLVEDVKARAQPEEVLGKELKKIREEIYDRQHDLYMAVPQLSEQPFKAEFVNLRKDPTWYMRKELIKDCSDRDGCCSRGFELSAEKRKARRDALSNKLGWASEHAVSLANSFFVKPSK